MPQLTGGDAKTGRWKMVKRSYTCAIPENYRPDILLVNQIRAFDPRFVHVFMIEEWVTPTGDMVAGFHVIGRHFDEIDPTCLDAPLVLDRGPDSGVVYAQAVWADEWQDLPDIHMGRDIRKEKKQATWRNWPRIYRPFDGRIVEWMKARHFQAFGEEGDYVQKIKARVDGDRAAQARELEKSEQEARERLNEDRRQLVSAIEGGRFFPERREAPLSIDFHVTDTRT